jgi:hypothetical protein
MAAITDELVTIVCKVNIFHMDGFSTSLPLFQMMGSIGELRDSRWS